MYKLAIKLCSLKYKRKINVDRKIWNDIGYTGDYNYAWVGIKYDGSTWNRVGDGQAADMEPNDWYDGTVPSGTGRNFANLVILSASNSNKNFRLMDTSDGNYRFICEKKNII